MNQKQSKVPGEAFRFCQCKCGSVYFDTVQRVQMYKKGLWSSKNLLQPVVTLVCLGCGVPFNEDEVILLENVKPIVEP